MWLCEKLSRLYDFLAQKQSHGLIERRVNFRKELHSVIKRQHSFPLEQCRHGQKDSFMSA